MEFLHVNTRWRAWESGRKACSKLLAVRWILTWSHWLWDEYWCIPCLCDHKVFSDGTVSWSVCCSLLELHKHISNVGALHHTCVVSICVVSVHLNTFLLQWCVPCLSWEPQKDGATHTERAPSGGLMGYLLVKCKLRHILIDWLHKCICYTVGWIWHQTAVFSRLQPICRAVLLHSPSAWYARGRGSSGDGVLRSPLTSM